MDEKIKSVASFDRVANEMADAALVALNETRIQLAHRIINIQNEVKLSLEKSTSLLYSEINSVRVLRVKEMLKAVNSGTMAMDSMLEDIAWKGAGFEIKKKSVPSPSAILRFVKTLPLKTFLLKEDSNRNLLVTSRATRDEMRTRMHIGLIDHELVAHHLSLHGVTGVSSEDPSLLLSYNLIALSSLAEKSERMDATLQSIGSLISSGSTELLKRIKAIREAIGIKYGKLEFVSTTQLAFEAAALESEASIKNVNMLSHQVKHKIRMSLIQFKHTNKVDLLEQRMQTETRTEEASTYFKTERRSQIMEAGASLDVFSTNVEMLKKVTIMKNTTQRELEQIKEKAASEIAKAKAQILFENDLERDHEMVSLKRIQLLGAEMRKEIVQLVEAVFQQIYGGIHHIMQTNKGKQQFLLILIVSGLVTFAVILTKEIITMVFSFLQRAMTTPQLVREYGNLPLQKNLVKLTLEDDIILPTNTLRRIAEICAANYMACKRGAPLRNILLYGKPGTGKTTTAKAIANAAGGIPYAIMSGADLAPLRRHGPFELRKLLTWAKSHQHGGIVIIDEAESALSSRLRSHAQQVHNNNISDDCKTTNDSNGFSRDALNVLLSMTGGTSGPMLILTTCYPEALDEAVLDRMDEVICLPIPSEQERYRIIQKEFHKRFGVENRKHHSFNKIMRLLPQRTDVRTIAINSTFKTKHQIERLARYDMTGGCSGREISKILRAVSNGVYASEKCTLIQKIWETVTGQMCRSMRIKRDLPKCN